MNDSPALRFFDLPHVIKDRFGIVIRDPDLWVHAVRRTGRQVSAYTAGHLLELISDRLRRQPMPERVAPFLPVYRQFRDALVEAYGLPKRAVRPSAPLDALVPRRGRRRGWKVVERRMGGPVPPLQPDRWVDLLASWIVLAVSIALFVLLVSPLLRPIAPWVERWLPRKGNGALLFVNVWLGTVVCSLCALYGSALLVRPFAVHFPHKFRTVREVVTQAADDPHGEFRRKRGLMPRRVVWADASTWYALRRALAEALGIRPREVRRESRLMADLGVGGPLCRQCRYDLRDAVSVCPECGTPVTRAAVEGAPASGVT